MLHHLPETILWNILQKCTDVKACVTVWCCCSDIYKRYDILCFWRYLCYYHFCISECSSVAEYWKHYSKKHGCSYCNRVLQSGSHMLPTVCLDTIIVPVCTRCKSILGETMIHKDALLPWQLNLVQKLRYKSHNSSESIFKNYFGDHQVQQCQSYQLKCTSCMRNIRNLRCPHYLCGKCCHCKYHKSHYSQEDNSLDTLLVYFVKHTPRNKKKKYIMMQV